MNKAALLFGTALVAVQPLFADYPRDAAQRFKMKYGINHPVVEQEAREARKAKLKTGEARQKDNRDKTSAGADDAQASNSEDCRCGCK